MADNLYLESEINATYDNDTNVLQTDGNSTSIKEDEVYLYYSMYKKKHIFVLNH